MRAGGRASDGSDDVGARCVNVSFGVSVSRGPLCKCIIGISVSARCVNVTFGVRAAGPGRETRARGEARVERRRRRYDATRARGGLISLVSFVRASRRVDADRARRRGGRDRRIGIRFGSFAF